jgi:hypothetical protein
VVKQKPQRKGTSSLETKSVFSSNLSRGIESSLKQTSSKTEQSRQAKIKARQIQFDLVQKLSDEFNLTQGQVFSLLSEFKGLLSLSRSSSVP